MESKVRRIVLVREVREEAHNVKTLTFPDPLCAEGRPGQFVMAWAPGVDEVPMSISGVRRMGEASITVEAIGEASNALYEKGPDEEVGVMGPMGRGFTLKDGNVVMVGGGMGVIPLAFLVEQMTSSPARISFFLGARTRAKLVFASRLDEALKRLGGELVITTDDGSMGRRGTTIEALETLLRKTKTDIVYACGPDAMVAKAFKLAEEQMIPMEASLQAYIKCAMGLCGSCCMGPYLVCRDGPVFSSIELRQMPELGVFRRDASGNRIPLQM